MQLKIEGNRAVLSGLLDSRVLHLTQQLEGMKKWLKTGGISFEPTPYNMEQFKAHMPDVPVEDARPPVSSLFEGWAGSQPAVVRGAYSPRTVSFPFQDLALALSGHFKQAPGDPPGQEGRVVTPPLDIPAPDHPVVPLAQPKMTPVQPLARPNWHPGSPARAFAVFGETGTGKSKILIDMAGQLWCAGLIDAVLIVSPKGVHEQWIDEQLPAHMGAVVPWQGVAIDQKKKLPMWQADKLAILSVNVDYCRLAHGYNSCLAFIEQFKDRVLMILDESHKIKSHASKRTENIIDLGARCAYRRIATGTPLSRDLTDTFSQYYFLDRQILGYEYVTTFKAAYCVMGGFDLTQVVGHKNVENFYGRIAPFTFRITKDEADLGLPPKHYAQHVFEMSAEQKHHYAAMKTDMITKMDTGELVLVKNVIVQLTRLQQIACGFLVNKVGDEETVQELENARLEALKEVIAGREGKMAIWCRYNRDIDVVAELLGKECVTYHGATSPDQRERAKRLFLDPDSNTRFFVANPAAGGTGLNLQGECRTVIYYSNSFNAVDRWQSEDRVHRIGTKYAITYFDLIARTSIDRKILANLRAKKSVSDLAFDDIRKLLNED